MGWVLRVGWRAELPLNRSGQKLFFPCSGEESALGRHCCRGGFLFFEVLFFVEELHFGGNPSPCDSSSHVAVRCLAAGGFFKLLRKALCTPRIHPPPPSPLLYASFSSRWDEFGQKRRDSESTAGPRCGPRVSFTENFKQQSGNFRELKQRVLGHRVGRYTVKSAFSNSIPSSECNNSLFYVSIRTFTVGCQRHLDTLMLRKSRHSFR